MDATHQYHWYWQFLRQNASFSTRRVTSEYTHWKTWISKTIETMAVKSILHWRTLNYHALCSFGRRGLRKQCSRDTDYWFTKHVLLDTVSILFDVWCLLSGNAFVKLWNLQHRILFGIHIQHFSLIYFSVGALVLRQSWNQVPVK